MADLVDECCDSLYRFCRSLTYSKEDAEDLFQETFLRALERSQKIIRSDNPQSLIFSTAAYIWKSSKRKYARRNRIAPTQPYELLDETVAGGSNTEDRVIAAEENRSVRELVRALPDKYKIPIILYYTVELSVIENADGSPFTADYEQTFLASPLVKGQAPWRLNAFFLNGSGSEIIVDGVIYRIAECDDVTIFADRGLYFAVADVMTFDNRTFLFDEVSGEISYNPDYEGASAIFDLPLDKSLADPEKAEKFLNGLA
jgi:RNA polymerase sigma-70 factor (ECF subfamily)